MGEAGRGKLWEMIQRRRGLLLGQVLTPSLCQVLNHLDRVRHLKYHSRSQLSLLLKGIGVAFEQSEQLFKKRLQVSIELKWSCSGIEK